MIIVKDYKLCIEDDQNFHEIIRTASRNEILIDVLDNLNTKTARFLQSIQYVIENFEWFFESLQDIANAIQDKNSEEARRYTEEHTRRFLEELSRNFFS